LNIKRDSEIRKSKVDSVIGKIRNSPVTLFLNTKSIVTHFNSEETVLSPVGSP
jgi:hypothetical protein